MTSNNKRYSFSIMSSSIFSPQNQPAISPYAPTSRNTFLYSHPNNNNKKNIAKNNHKKLSFVILYFILKFWDTPILQKVYTDIIKSLWGKSISILSKNEIINKYILQSNIGFVSGKLFKKGRLFIAYCLIEAIERLRLDKVLLLNVPVSIKEWVEMNNQQQEGSESSINNNSLQLSDEQSDLITTSSNITIDQVKYHGQQIDNIIQYWFGQYTPDKAQKNLWMIASSSKEQLEKVDSEIATLYSSLLLELGTNVTIRKLWCDLEYTLFGWKGKLAAIILLDQMSRHIHRYLKSDYNSHVQSNKRINVPSQKVLDDLVFEIAKSFQQQHSAEIACGMIPTPMLIFALMPYRHASTLQTVGFVQSKVEEIASLNSLDMENMIRRFRRATNRRMAIIQDEARRAGKSTYYDQGGDQAEADEKQDSENVGNIEFSDDDILEFHSFTADMSNAHRHSIVKTIISFLSLRGIHPNKNNDEKIVRDTPILVSLSGGVDSMVIASTLSFLRDECNYDQLYLVAVHIDYGNRPESTAEARFVKNYASHVIHFDDCIVRRIDEVTRGETKRDEYEKVSRNVRYDLYKDTIAGCIEVCTALNPKRALHEVGVMLGHHRGDIVENVISNSNKGCGPLDLSGMTDVSRNDGVTIYRPLLPLNKGEVYDYSHKFGIPYFKDTTPHWSTRGKLRNKLIPLLEEVYGDGCLNNLAKLAGESDEARELFNKTSFIPFMDTVKRFPMGVIFSTIPFKNQGTYFWKIVLRDLLHSIGLGMFSDKSIEAFLSRALSEKRKSGWLQCRKDYAVYLMDDGRVMVLVSFFLLVLFIHS